MPEAILVHDGARPFIQPEEIDAIVALSLEFGASVPANRPKDTIKRIGMDPGFFGETLDRAALLQVQTPQGFRANILIDAHQQAEKEGWYATDDAALVERYFPPGPPSESTKPDITTLKSQHPKIFPWRRPYTEVSRKSAKK